ncbi:MAG: GNAT family N-acetyltransferase [Thermoplasmata archaeon]|nr:GNAT family N-acetyltransferase [Thermoplasmata archaeon]
MSVVHEESRIEHALEEERAFIHTLGGYTFETAGARLVTHERIAVPRFNFIQDVRVSADRQSGFFERALDHYFQRALRPEVRARQPTLPHIDRTLTSLGFKLREEAHELLLATAVDPGTGPASPVVREARPSDLDVVVDFWVGARERDEFRRSVQVAWERPNPEEELVPLLADGARGPIAAALVHTHRGLTGVHAVATQPAARGQGAASALVRAALARSIPAGRLVAMHSDSPRLTARLRLLGFQTVRTYGVYELPRNAELALPTGGAMSPPRWRPPRRTR